MYGVHGIGKSTFASQSPNPIFISTEEGVNDLEVAKFPVSKSFAEVTSRLATLATEQHKFQTVVIDSLDWLERLIHQEVCKEKGVTQIDEIGFFKGYSYALEWWHEILRALVYLRDHKNMGVVLVAHAQISKFQDPDADDYDRHFPSFDKRAVLKVCEWCDEVFFAGYKVFTKKEGEGFRETNKVVGSGSRIIRTGGKPTAICKNRLGMPEELPLAWSSYAEHYSK